MKKKILSLALSLTLMAGLAVPVRAANEEPTFTDVPATHWAYAYVEQAAEKGWIKGNPDGTFAPNSNVTYAQFSVMLIQAFFPDELADYTGPGSPWFVPYSGTAAGLGLYDNTNVQGRQADTTAMNGEINRYEMAGMLYPALKRAANLSISIDYQAAASSTPDFTSIPRRYQDAVAAAKAYGLISGVDSAGSFGGTASMTRAQAAVVLCKMNEIVQEQSAG